MRVWDNKGWQSCSFRTLLKFRMYFSHVVYEHVACCEIENILWPCQTYETWRMTLRIRNWQQSHFCGNV